jgi:hypothetical protein
LPPTQPVPKSPIKKETNQDNKTVAKFKAYKNLKIPITTIPKSVTDNVAKEVVKSVGEHLSNLNLKTSNDDMDEIVLLDEDPKPAKSLKTLEQSKTVIHASIVKPETNKFESKEFGTKKPETKVSNSKASNSKVESPIKSDQTLFVPRTPERTHTNHFMTNFEQTIKSEFQMLKQKISGFNEISDFSHVEIPTVNNF